MHFDVERSGTGTGAPLRGLVYVAPKRPKASAAFVGFDYRGVYSRSYASDVTLSSALLLRDLSGPGSALLASASVINDLRFAVEYLQPLGPAYLKPWARYAYEHDVYSTDGEPISLGVAYRSVGAGAWLGAALGRRAEIMLGYSFEDLVDALSTGTGAERAATVRGGALRAALAVDSLDSRVLPLRGLEARLYGRLFDPALGGSLRFAQLDLSGQLAAPLSAGSALGLAWAVTSDLSGLVEGFGEAPLPFMASLRRPGMFYGATDWGIDSIGLHVAGLGLEYRIRLGSLHPLLGGDLLAFANLSGGLAALSPSLAGDGSFSLRLSASVGLGARLSESFGALAALSLQNGPSVEYPVVPALTLELGSFATRAEELR